MDYSEPEFDSNLRTQGLHTVRRKVEFISRETVLPPDLFEQFNQWSFWTNPSHSRAHVIVAQPTASRNSEVIRHKQTDFPSQRGKANPKPDFIQPG